MLLVLSLSSFVQAAAPDTGIWTEAFPCDGDPECTLTSSMEEDLIDLFTVNTLHAFQVFPGSLGELVLCDGGFIDDADSDWTLTPYTLDGAFAGRDRLLVAQSNNGFEWAVGIQTPYGEPEGMGYEPVQYGIPTGDYYWGIDLGNTGKVAGVDEEGYVHVWGVGGDDLDGVLTNSGYIQAGVGRNTVCATGRINGGVDCASLEEASLVTNVNRPTTGTCPRVGVGRYGVFAVCDGYLNGWGKNTSAMNSLIANAPTSYGWKNVNVASIGYSFAIALADDNTVTVWAGSDGPFPDAIQHAPGWAQCHTGPTDRLYKLQYYEAGACHPLKVRSMPQLNEYATAHTYGLVVLDGGGVYGFGTPLIVGGSSTPEVVAETCDDIY